MINVPRCSLITLSIVGLACGGNAGGHGSGGSGGITGMAGTAGTSGTGGTTGVAGAIGAAGASGAAGTFGPAGATGAGGSPGGAGLGGSIGGVGGSAGAPGRFSFFVTSLTALRTLSSSPNGFGGDLRFGETGDGAGLRGADKICTVIAEMSMPGAGVNGWHAFLSAPADGSSPQVNAIDRIGNGPWYDRLGRLVASDKASLLGFRPADADPVIKNDLPNEYGIPNHGDGAPGCVGNACPDNHDTLTGSGEDGKLWTNTRNTLNPTCSGWTTAVGGAGLPHMGHSWNLRNGGQDQGGLAGIWNLGHWISSLDEAGCAPGVNLEDTGGPKFNNPTVGSGGGYGGFYCFALAP